MTTATKTEPSNHEHEGGPLNHEHDKHHDHLACESGRPHHPNEATPDRKRGHVTAHEPPQLSTAPRHRRHTTLD